jgi:hypothetical protein
VTIRGDKRGVQKSKAGSQTDNIQLSSSLSPLNLSKEFSVSPSKAMEVAPGEESSTSPINRSKPVPLDVELIGQVFMPS